jgi:hypothetical protein
VLIEAIIVEQVDPADRGLRNLIKNVGPGAAKPDDADAKTCKPFREAAVAVSK